MTTLTYRVSIDIDPMIDALKAHVSQWLAEGKIDAGGKVAHLMYFELDPEERKMFHQRLDGYHFPGTPYRLVWNAEANYFELMPTVVV